MKKILKFGIPVVLLCLLFDFTGCQLARPEKTGPETDEFIGFHLVPERFVTVEGPDGGEWEMREGSDDRSHWVEYGTEDMELEGFGTVAFPRQILIGTYNEDTRRYDFPGKEGYNCFLAIHTGEDGTNYINGYTDMTETSLDRRFTDEGEENILKAALYTETMKEGEEFYDYILTAYRVFQMDDGTVYIDGTGNSYAGAGFTINERREITLTTNGESTKQILDIEFSLKEAMRVEQVEITWFDEEERILSQELLPMEELEGEHTLTPPAGAAWAMVRETGEDGTVQRTASTPDYNGVGSHKLILMDETGIGRAVWLRWEKP